MRSIFKQLGIFLCFLCYFQHSFCEIIKSFFAFCFCRLDHQCLMNDEREINCRSMESIIKQSFGNIKCFHAILFEFFSAGNKFMHDIFLVGDRIFGNQFLHKIIRIYDSIFGNAFQSLIAQHFEIYVCSNQHKEISEVGMDFSD